MKAIIMIDYQADNITLYRYGIWMNNSSPTANSMYPVLI